MTFLTFDPKAQSYLPADKLLLDRGIKQTAATARVHKVADENEEQLAPPSQQLTQRALQNAYQQGGKAPHELERALTAEQIMSSPVVTLRIDATIAEARALFRERRFRHVPIVSATNSLMGIVSDRDVLRHALDSPQTTIQHLITERILVASLDTEIREVAKVLFDQRIGAMPIIDGDENLVGIITRSDILRALVNHAPLELWI